MDEVLNHPDTSDAVVFLKWAAGQEGNCLGMLPWGHWWFLNQLQSSMAVMGENWGWINDVNYSVEKIQIYRKQILQTTRHYSNTATTNKKTYQRNTLFGLNAKPYV